MAFKLPRLTTDVDCEPIGYPGLLVTFWLNPRPDELELWEPPWGDIEDDTEDEERMAQEREAQRHLKECPWDRPFYFGLAQLMDRVTVPAEYTDGPEVEVWEITDSKALYDLENAPGFDQSIILWAQSRLQQERQGRLQAEVKN